MYKVFFKESCFLLTDDQNLLKEGTISLVHQNFNEELHYQPTPTERKIQSRHLPR